MKVEPHPKPGGRRHTTATKDLVLGCRHLLSRHPNGIEIQTCCAIIACLRISLTTGRKPTLRTYEMLCFDFSGLADEDELLAHLNRLPRHEAAS